MTVNEYLDHVTPGQKAEYQRLKGIVRQLAPDVEEVISYGIPTFKYKGKYVLYFGAFKDHMSVFPGAALVESIREKLDGYKIAKGTIQYTEAKPIPEAVVKEIIQSRLEQIA